MRPSRSIPTSSRLAEVGLFLVVVATPLLFTPFTEAPFADPKLVTLLAGATLLAAARPHADRRLCAGATAWVFVLVLATLFGRDPWWSLMGPENQATGLLALAASALLLCVGSGIDQDLRSRLPTWLFWTGAAVSAVAIVGRFVDFGGLTWRLGTLSSTLGHRVFAGGLIGASIIATTRLGPRVRTYLGLLVLGSGLAVTAVRSAWLGTAVGLLMIPLLDRRSWRRVLGVLIPVILAVAVWTAADLMIAEKELEFSAAPRFAQISEGSAEERIPALRAFLRAWADEPILGSGPGTGWHAYLSHATTDDVRIAGRGFGDAHNLLIEIGATTGSVSAMLLVAIAGIVLVRVRGAPREDTWALGAAIAVGAVQAVQPLSVVLTPLLFLTAAIATGPPARDERVRIGRWVAVAGSFAVLLASARFSASFLERYGTTYASERALRWSLRAEPLRTGAALSLARHRAFDSRARDPAGAADARRLIETSVRSHGWNPGVRPEAANVEVLLENLPAARAWLDEHLALFPNDPLALGGAAVLALRSGDLKEARDLARRALDLDPDSPLALSVLQSDR